MSNMTWASLLNAGQFSQTQLGVALASSTSATDVSAGAAVVGEAFTFPAAYLQPDQQYRVKANGIVSTTGTPNLTLGVYWGGIAGTALAATGAIATASGLSNQTWLLTLDIRVDAVGSSGSARSIGSVTGPYSTVALMPATSSSGNNVTIDTSSAKVLTVGAQWGTSSASNSIQVCQFTVELLN